MKNIVMLAALAGTSSVAMANHVLTVDLSVLNQVTITATTNLSAATASGSTGTGFYLANFFNTNGSLSSTGVAGNSLTTFNNPSDGTPLLFRGGTSDPGLNVWSYSTNSTSSFTAGTQAFAGSGTWNVSAAVYALFANANTSGNIFFPADTADDITPSTALIGTYSVVPTPGAAAMLGLGGLAALRRRRA